MLGLELIGSRNGNELVFQGIPKALVLIFLECMIVYLLYRIYKRRVQEELDTIWMKVMIYAIILHTAMGIAANVMLILSSSINLLVCGNLYKMLMISCYLFMVIKKDWWSYLESAIIHIARMNPMKLRR